MIASNKIPYISASYSEHLVFDKTPYNFIGATTYSDQARLALQWIKDNWKDKSRAPRVALIYNDTGFGRSPIQDAEDFAKKIGVEIVDKEIVGLAGPRRDNAASQHAEEKSRLRHQSAYLRWRRPPS